MDLAPLLGNGHGRDKGKDVKAVVGQLSEGEIARKMAGAEML